MAAQLAFDTLAFVKRLSAAGMETRQAEALAEALVGGAFQALATKSDIHDVRGEMREMEQRIVNTLTARMGAMIAASTALTVAILGGLISLH
jgi:hypothetical protein